MPLSMSGWAAHALVVLSVLAVIEVTPGISRLSCSMISTPFADFSISPRYGRWGHRCKAHVRCSSIAAFVCDRLIRSTWRRRS